MGTKDDNDLTVLLKEKLDLGKDEDTLLDAKSRKVQKELDRSGFTIFRCISDHGFFSWKTSSTYGKAYKSLSSIHSCEEVTRYIDLKGTPDKLVNLSSLRLPQTFLSLAPQEYENIFPFGQIAIASLYVAAKDREIDLDKVDFVFGGSTLEMLANCDMSNPYFATRIPGKTAIIVVKHKEYTGNLADVGFQFERLVTGHHFNDRLPVDWVEHLHLMQIGQYKVLFRAEADAMLPDGMPVEVKASNPRYWGTKVMFQMISNGSIQLCHGVKGRGQLQAVYLKSLSSVSQDALSGASKHTLEKNIVKGMDSILSEITSLSKDGHDDQVFNVSFRNGSLHLLPAKGRSAAVLPPPNVVHELL